MGRNSSIEWTNDSWNPWQGCKKVSPGCKNCYMYRDKYRYGQNPFAVVRSKPNTFNAPLTKLKGPLVFTCSWSDFFIQEADGWRDDAWDIIRKTPHLTYQILTKRPERIKDHLPDDWGEGWANAYLGVSVESKYQLHRIDHLKQIKAKVKFLSLEPLIAPIYSLDLNGIDWVIVGGESGSGYRPMKSEWARYIRDQCQVHNIPFFFKQWSGLHPKKLGKELDGVEWCEMPEVA